MEANKRIPWWLRALLLLSALTVVFSLEWGFECFAIVVAGLWATKAGKLEKYIWTTIPIVVIIIVVTLITIAQRS